MINGVEPILPSTKAELYQLLVNGENLGSRSLSEVKGDLLRPLPEDYISWKPTFSKGKNKKMSHILPGQIAFSFWIISVQIIPISSQKTKLEINV